MTKATFTYLDHRIEIELPDPTEDNTIHCSIFRLPGTYDAVLYNDFVTNYQFSAVEDDPNLWVVEAIKSAIQQLAFSGNEYHTPPQEPYVDDSLPEWANCFSNESDYFACACFELYEYLMKAY